MTNRGRLRKYLGNDGIRQDDCNSRDNNLWSRQDIRGDSRGKANDVSGNVRGKKEGGDRGGVEGSAHTLHICEP